MNRTFLNWSILSRRGFLFTTAAALPPWKGWAATPSCVLTSEQEEGPYYVEEAKLRADITEGKPGVPLTMRIALVDAKLCAPLSNAALDIWHCDAAGVYSGFTSNQPGGFGGGPGGPPPGPPPDGRPGPRGGPGPRKIDATRFLRGVQITNRNGIAEFTTLYPGWYLGRAIHIHLKVHFGGERAADTYAGGHVCHTGQLFFPEDVTERISRMQPYAQHLNVHRTTQEQDGIFRSGHGGNSIVQLERTGNRSEPDGFIANVTVAVDPELTPQTVRGPGRGPGGPPPFPR